MHVVEDESERWQHAVRILKEDQNLAEHQRKRRLIINLEVEVI